MSVVRTKLVTETYDLGSLRLYREDLVSIATAVAEAGDLKIVLVLDLQPVNGKTAVKCDIDEPGVQGGSADPVLGNGIPPRASELVERACLPSP
jgi:hypothetical protein